MHVKQRDRKTFPAAWNTLSLHVNDWREITNVTVLYEGNVFFPFHFEDLMICSEYISLSCRPYISSLFFLSITESQSAYTSKAGHQQFRCFNAILCHLNPWNTLSLHVNDWREITNVTVLYEGNVFFPFHFENLMICSEYISLSCRPYISSLFFLSITESQSAYTSKAGHQQFRCFNAILCHLNPCSNSAFKFWKVFVTAEVYKIPLSIWPTPTLWYDLLPRSKLDQTLSFNPCLSSMFQFWKVFVTVEVFKMPL